MLVIAADLKESLQRCKIINDGHGKFYVWKISHISWICFRAENFDFVNFIN